MTKTNWGLKRQCLKCDSRFYDLGKNPAKCPKCGTMHDINAPVKRRGRAKPAVVVDKDDPLVQVKARQEARQKKSVKRIEGVEVEFEDIDTGTDDDEIEEIEEIEEEDIESLEELEDRDDGSEALDDDVTLEDEDVVAGVAILDEVVEEPEIDEEEDEDEEEEGKKSKSSAKSKKSAPPPAKKAVPAKKPAKPLNKKKK